MSWVYKVVCCVYIFVTFQFVQCVDPHITAMIMSVKTRRGDAYMKYIEGDPDKWVKIVRAGGSQAIKDFGKSNSNDVFEKLASSFNQRTVVWSNSAGNEIEYGKLVLFSSSFTTTVKRAHYDSSKQIGGITVDWTTNNIYWTDQMYNWILMAPLDERRIFSFVVTSGLDKPGGICVHPAKSFLFWTDYGSNPKIERSDLLGQNRKTIVSVSLLKPVAIDIDLRTDSLYWTDSGTAMIETCKLDGSQRRGLIQKSFVSYVVGISLFKDHMFAVSSNSYLHLINTSSAVNEKSVSLSRIYTTMYDVTTMSEVTQPNMSSPCSSAGCSSMCVGTSDNSRAQCVCPWDQQLMADGVTCTASTFKTPPLYMYTSGTNLCWYNVWAPDMINNQIQHNCDYNVNTSSKALGYHLSKKYMYIGSGTRINRVLLKNGETVTEFIANAGTVRAISVDWIHDILYWTTAEGLIYSLNLIEPIDYTTKSIVVAPNDGVYGLVVEPFSRHLFWTSYGRSPCIKRSSLDGTSQVTLVSTDIMQPESLTIDYADFRLYWTDSVKGTIESVNLDGTDRRQVVKVTGSKPYGIAVFQDYIAWTDNKPSFPSMQWWYKHGSGLVRTHSHYSHSGAVVLYGEYSQPTNFTAPDITITSTTEKTTLSTKRTTAIVTHPTISTSDLPPVKEEESGVAIDVIIIVSVLVVGFVLIVLLVAVGLFIYCCVTRRRNQTIKSPEAPVHYTTSTGNVIKSGDTDYTQLSQVPPGNEYQPHGQPPRESEYHEDDAMYDVIDDKNIEGIISQTNNVNSDQQKVDISELDSDYLTPKTS